jgi:ABC-2 type transport system ATP-binding protein
MEEAEVLCDRLAIMDHGRVLEAGTVAALVDSRFSERAVRLDTIDGLDLGRLEGLRGVSAVRTEGEETVLYTSDVPATIGGILAVAESAGVEPRNLAVRRATLEDVFLDLTGRALRD